MINLETFENKLQPKEESPPKPVSHNTGGVGGASDADIAVRCLDYLAPWRVDDYQGGGWLDTGMALHSAGATVNDWDQWSQQSSKYKPGECAKKWRSFGKRDGRAVTVASLIDWAAQDAGLTRAELMQRINPNHKPRPNDSKSPQHSPKTRIAPTILPWRPFPVEVLPEPIRSFVKQAAQAIVCDVCFVVLPILTALASAIGNTRRIRLKRGWSEPAIIWAGIVGDSGSNRLH
jgi:hypothetical protein